MLEEVWELVAWTVDGTEPSNKLNIMNHHTEDHQRPRRLHE